MNEAPRMKVAELRWIKPDTWLTAVLESTQEKYRVEALLSEKPKRLTLTINDENGANISRGATSSATACCGR